MFSPAFSLLIERKDNWFDKLRRFIVFIWQRWQWFCGLCVAYLSSIISENVFDFLRLRSNSSISSFFASTTRSIICSTRFRRPHFQLSKFCVGKKKRKKLEKKCLKKINKFSNQLIHQQHTKKRRKNLNQRKIIKLWVKWCSFRFRFDLISITISNPKWE